MSNKQTIFEQLAPFSRMIVAKGVTVGQLAFANNMVLTTAATFVTTTNAVGVGGAHVADNTSVPLFQTALTEVGQGWTTGLSLNQTNSKFSRGTAPRNQVFIGTHFGCNFSITSAIDPSATMIESYYSTNDLWALILGFSWDLTIARGVKRTIGYMSEYPDLGPVWAEDRVTTVPTSSNGYPDGMCVQLPIPIIFPPEIGVEISANCGSGFDLINAATGHNCVIRAGLKGFLMTMPV